MELLVILVTLICFLAVAWFVIKLVIAYAIACLALLGILTIKEKLDL